MVSGEEPGHCLTIAPSPGSGSGGAQAWEWGCFFSLSYTKVNDRIVVVKVKQPSPCWTEWVADEGDLGALLIAFMGSEQMVQEMSQGKPLPQDVTLVTRTLTWS